MTWIWDVGKDRRNRRKHGIGFDLAILVFDDPLSLSRVDAESFEEERWQTIGVISGVVIFVVHTASFLDETGVEVSGRIISARKATKRERKAYEEDKF